MKFFSTFFFFLVVLNSMLSQTKDTVGVLDKAKEHVKISGGIGALGTFYQSTTMDSTRNPIFYQLNANLNIKVGSVSIPFSAVLNQQESKVSQPFNQYGLSPRYKGITAHLGYRTLKFSDYSLSGNQFLGVGADINPKNSMVRGKALYGRFAKEIVPTINPMGDIIGVPNLSRFGYGAMIEVGKRSNAIGVLVFKARDNLSSDSLLNQDATLKPGENLIFGVTTKQKISKKLSLKGEIDWSAYTKDLRNEETVMEGFSYLNNISPLFHANSSSTLTKAIKADLDYSLRKVKLGLAYRRIDPGYRTMGSVYLNNDFEDIQAKSTFRLFKNKLTLGGSFGIQRNNLDDSKYTEMLRVISSLNANYTINEHWVVNGMYSNFNSSSHSVLTKDIDTDSLRYIQVTRNSALQIMYAKANKVRRIAVSLRGNYQAAQTENIDATSINYVYNSALGVQYGFIKTGLNINLSLNGAKNINATSEITTIGPSLALSKRFLSGKLNTSLGFSVLKTIYDMSSGAIISTKILGTYKVNRHHNFNLSLSDLDKTTIISTTDKTHANELVISLGYNYSF